jgi:hypothetical protein
MAQVRASQGDFVWTTIPSPEKLERQRLAAMATFLVHCESGRRQGRSVAGEAQALPFIAAAFDLALSSHVLLLDAEALPLPERRLAIAELLLVDDELQQGGHTLRRILRPVLTNEAIEALAADFLAPAPPWRAGGAGTAAAQPPGLRGGAAAA